MSQQLTFPQLIQLAEQHQDGDSTLAYMLATIKMMEYEVRQWSSANAQQGQIVINVLDGVKGYGFSPDLISVQNTVAIERRVFAIHTLCDVLASYLGQHHSVQVAY